MTDRNFALFETLLGCCGIGWSAAGIFRVSLPEGRAEAVRELMLRRHPDAGLSEPDDEVRPLISAIGALLGGEPVDLRFARLDLAGLPEFSVRVYRAAQAIPPGRTATYGEIAAEIGSGREARAVGEALGRNPFPIIVPCHRVLAAGGRTGGFSAQGGVETKLKMLTIERARTSAEPSLFDGGDWPLAARRR